MNITPIRPPWGGTMTGRERFNRQMNYQSVDRSFNMEFGYWDENFTEWDIFRDNGIRDNAQADRFFSFDRIEGTGPSFGGWMHPSFERRIYEHFGDKIALMGGFDVRPVASNDRDGIRRELEAKIPFVKRNNGFILHSDHSIPESTEYETYQYFLELGRELGTY